jgi:multiple sugar transport system substrate-binding protein
VLTWRNRTFVAVAFIVAIAGASVSPKYGATERAQPSEPKRIDITLYRFFGGCSDQYSGVTDISVAVGECGIMQVLTNGFNAGNDLGALVHTQNIEWSAYYDRLSAAYATRHPPTIAIMNRSVLPRFANRGLLLPLKQDLLAADVLLGDVIPAALEGVMVNGEVYALPFDIHALLWHINLDLMAEAGLMNERGEPVLPNSPEELLTQAKQVRDKTGQAYLAIPSQTDPMPVWTFETWVWQQSSTIIASDLRTVQVDTLPARRALDLLQDLYDKGHANRNHDYAGAEQAFLNGEAAVLVNGTWVVDGYLAQAQQSGVKLKRYTARTVPTLFNKASAWTDSHVWVLPRPEQPDADKHRTAIAFLKFLFEHSAHWAKTGHLPVRISALASRTFQSLPERTGYMDTAAIAQAPAAVDNRKAVQDALIQEINATWLLPRSPHETLQRAQQQIERILERTQR